jgi:8-oxo-dGTP pyrophosphatase MutT (NUDIX family)
MSTAPPPLPRKDPGAPAVRPKDAATLMIYEYVGGKVQVLMGERNARHRFMPKRYVFPGGRIDPGDSRVRVAAGLRDDVDSQLQRKLSAARARAMAVAAVRETFEESGLIIGARDPRPGHRVAGDWRDFFATGMAPALDNLVYIARAVTPPHRPVRFNARFFMIEARHVEGDLAGSGELLGQRWFPIDEARELETAGITQRVLYHIEDLLADPPPRKPDQPIPYFKHMGDHHLRIDE